MDTYSNSAEYPELLLELQHSASTIYATRNIDTKEDYHQQIGEQQVPSSKHKMKRTPYKLSDWIIASSGEDMVHKGNIRYIKLL